MADNAEQLVLALQNELQCHERLASLLENKLQAMRSYDVRRLESLADSEKQLLDTMHVLAVKRRHVADVLGKQILGKLNRPATAKELAAASDEPAQSKLYALCGMLAEACQKVRRLNRVNDIASRKMLGHVDQMFRAIAQVQHDVGLYGPGGRKPLAPQNRIFDAIA